MSLQLLHQVGHNSVWNVDSFVKDHAGDGLILSPLHQNRTSVENLAATTRAASMFDPQFYLPSSRKQKLHSYPFFPEKVEGGFQTGTFASHSAIVAKLCVEFQVAMGFRNIVVPTRYIKDLYTNYVERQRTFTVDAFVAAAGQLDICLTLAVTPAMIEDISFRTKLLNWVTSYPNVTEIYLLYQYERDSKQIQDANFLSSCILFVREILSSGLRVTVGYSNTEGLLFASEDVSITMGSFENTRIFSLDKFVESEGERRGPKARIFLPGLLNWVQFQDAKLIRKLAPEVWNAAYSPTPYGEEALALAVEPTFNQPQLYKHYFLNMQQIVSQMKPLDRTQRLIYLREKLVHAQALYQIIKSKNIHLELHGRGAHINHWMQALQKFV